MGIVTTNFIKGRMNKSIDERLLPPGEYIDALNVRLGSTETTEVGAVENSRGNEQLTTIKWNNVTFSTNAITIGALEDGIHETIYWFVHDPSNSAVGGGTLDAIISYNTISTGVTIHVASTSVLNFNTSYLITGVSLIDDLLFWTDDLNPPRKINVTRNYLDPNTTNPYSDNVTVEDLNVILKPPGYSGLELSAPTLELLQSPGDENYIENRFLSFAYRFRYEDNEYSATSLFSLAAFQPGAFRFDTNNYNNAGMVNEYNSVRVSFNTGPRQVKQVDLLYKDSNSNTIFVIEKFDKSDYGWANNSVQTYVFNNSKIYNVIGSDELLRLYDNVPRTAKAQIIQGNRLMYGNYVDQYNITNSTESKIAINYQTSLKSILVDAQSLENATLSTGIDYTLSGTSVTVINSLASFDLTDIATKLKKDSTISFDIRLTRDQINGTTTTPCYLPTFSNGDATVSFSFRLPTDFSSVYDMASSPEFASRIGTVLNSNFQPIATCAQGSSLTDTFNCALSVPTNCANWTKFNSSITNATAQQGFRYVTTPGSNIISFQPIAMQFQDITNGVTTNLWEYFRVELATGNFTSTFDTGSLHSNRDYETGLVYMDDFARASTVLVSEYNTVYVPASASISKNEIQVTISSFPPSWATRYKFVVKPSKAGYETIYSNFFYVRPSNNNIYFKLEGDNQNKVTKGQTLFVKRDVSGPIETIVECEILDVVAEAENFLATTNELGEDTFQLPGLYMIIKAQNFNVAVLDDAVIEEGEIKDRSDSENRCTVQANYPAFTSNTTVNPTTYNVYNIPAGSIIYIKAIYGRQDRCCGCNGKRYEFEKQFVSSGTYGNLYEWFVGDNIDPNTGVITEGNTGDSVFVTDIATSASNVTCVDDSARWQFWQQNYNGTINLTEPLYLAIKPGIKGCRHQWPAKDSDAFCEIEIVITRANNLMVFETEPAAANTEIFYDASEDFEIEGGFHQINGKPGDIKQTANTDAFITLDFMDVYTFGNGVESYKIKDLLAAKSVVMGQRALGASNTDYSEADRFNEMTYSGVYSSNSGVNNLNEFNLGLANFKVLESSFGPIMKMHPRETDILVLQEDRISYVIAGKNVITDAVGGGSIISVPQILGTQIARIEEYGISFNPESFVAHGFHMFFTDTKRLAVLQLKGTDRNNTALTVISEQGMRSWFRDQFITQLTTQKLGAFDPYMDEYVLNTNDIPVPFPVPPIPCGTTLEFNNKTIAKDFVIDFGQIIDSTATVTLTVTGTVVVSGVWNGITGTPVTITNTTGNYTFNKSLNSPTKATITVTPTNAASYSLVGNCPTEENIKIIQVVLNSNVDAGQFIHAEYGWNTATHVSPIASTSVELGSNSTIASLFDLQSGVRSLGVFPYDGVDFFIGTNKIGTDNFDVNSLPYTLRYLSSSFAYANTTNGTTGIPALLAAATNIIPAGLITSPAPNIFRGTITPSTTPAFTLPLSNTYLYVIYDFRTTTAQQLCFDVDSGTDACCDCTFVCTSWQSSRVQSTATTACGQPLNQTFYFLNTNPTTTYPVVGSLVYSGSTCDPTNILQIGFYKYTSGWIQVNSAGIVIQQGTC